MSLTSKLRAKKVATRQVKPLTQGSQGIKLTVQDSKSLEAEEVLSAVNDCDAFSFQNTMFISDKSMTREMKNKLDDFPKIKEWTDQFINRDCMQLCDLGVSSCWVNLSDKKARGWLQINLAKPEPYTTILVWNGNKKQKYLLDLADKIDIKIRGSDLDKLKSLSFTDLLIQSLNFQRIHQPAGKLDELLSCFGCSSGLKRSKSSNC
tara:strand:+ start:1647 stop:2264 length:618 start_codon:yes stop_codon:yes gene_type:complete